MKHKKSESKLIKSDQPCGVPPCTSSDGRAYYDNGDRITSHCFVCENDKLERYKDGAVLNTPTATDDFEDIESLRQIKEDFESRGFQERKIPKNIAEAYGVKVGYSNSGEIIYHYYPVHGEGNRLVGYQRRDVENKKFYGIGKVGNENQLIGSDVANDRRILVITEGVLDAMSYQTAIYKKYKKFFPVVSLINGAGGASKQIAHNLEFINSFEKVILMFDSDEVGRDAAHKCAKMIRTGKAFIADLSQHGKDASDYLVAGKTTELLSSVWEARQYSPAGIVNSIDTFEEFIKDRREDSVPYPECFGNVNDMTFGRRTGELSVFTAGTGAGKSTFSKEDIYHLLLTTEDMVGIVSLEESVRETMDRVVGIHINKAIYLPDTVFDRSGDEGKQAWEETMGLGRLTLLDHQGSVTDDSLLTKMEYMIALGCKWLYLDHITMAVSEADGNQNQAMDKLMSDLLKLCKKHDVWIGVVSHLRKSPSGGKSFEAGADITEDDLKGSGSLKQVSMQTIAFSRNKYADDEDDRQVVKISVLKNRFSGVTGPAGAARYDQNTGRLFKTVMDFL
jgi:twinkle protein